jgi:hypothetical protein
MIMGGRDGKKTGPNTDETKNLEVLVSSTVFPIASGKNVFWTGK